MSFYEQQVLEQLKLFAAVITDSHIVYTSGKHGDKYINKDAIYPHPEQTAKLAWEIAKRFVVLCEVDVVIAPAVGGIILGQWVAYHLASLVNRPILSVYAEKYGDEFVFNRGYGQLIKGQRGLVVEDILTTGTSARKVVEAARQQDCEVIGVGALCNRGNVTVENLGNVPRLEALLNLQFNTYDANNCPLCQAGVPINTTVGKGREFLARRA